MASILKVDSMQGVTSAGDITITSEGGSATQSLQQGLAKAWCYISSSGTVLSDSLNIGSIADNGTGSYQANFTNNMNNVLFSQALTSGTYTITAHCAGMQSDSATSNFRIRGLNGNETAAVDIPDSYGTIHGDLA